MSEQSGYQVSGNAAELYEQYATRYFMGPWAPELVELAALRRGERVLDLACGTGLLARLAAPEVGPAGQVTGLDFNSGMLAVARTLPSPSGASITWVEGSASAMDIPDASFDVILCQQGLQFFPDKPKALREMRRVLAPGGRVLLSVWKAAGPYNIAVGEALERHVGTETATKYRASRIVPDARELDRLLLETGFRAVEVRPSSKVIRLPSIEKFVLGHLSSSPVAAAVAALKEEGRAIMAQQVKSALQPYAEGDGVAVPDEINIAMASG
ncbi:MAG: class I SAM-dependent methyltransferase [Burkholderiales bacterium]